MLKKIKFLLIAFALIIGATFLGTLVVNWHKSHRAATGNNELLTQYQGRTVWVNVFVHGSFATLLGLLNLPSVFKDQLFDTSYKKITREMRNDQFFFRQQPILQRGLKRIEPSFDLATTGGNKLAVYPIAKAFDTIQASISPKREHQFYYTFGWSGLMSQQRRRLEAIRFYNALQEELASLISQGFTPKIRLIAHSHGGNVCLNFAAIARVTSSKTFSPHYKFSTFTEENDSINKMLDIIRGLPTQENAARQPGQRHYEYVPSTKKMVVDELILLGTPLQPETEWFCLSPFFKKIYHIYSDADTVQGLDGFTTKQFMSSQRMSEFVFALAQKRAHKNKPPHVMQIKIMYERPLDTTKVSSAQAQPEEQGFWSKLFQDKPATKDPDHKALWFFNWRDNDAAPSSFLSPLPTVVLLPAIQSIADKHVDQVDFDLNIAPQDSYIGIFAVQHETQSTVDQILLDKKLIETLKTQCAAWRPDDASEAAELAKVSQYLYQKATGEK